MYNDGGWWEVDVAEISTARLTREVTYVVRSSVFGDEHEVTLANIRPRYNIVTREAGHTHNTRQTNESHRHRRTHTAQNNQKLHISIVHGLLLRFRREHEVTLANIRPRYKCVLFTPVLGLCFFVLCEVIYIYILRSPLLR